MENTIESVKPTYINTCFIQDGATLLQMKENNQKLNKKQKLILTKYKLTLANNICLQKKKEIKDNAKEEEELRLYTEQLQLEDEINEPEFTQEELDEVEFDELWSEKLATSEMLMKKKQYISKKEKATNTELKKMRLINIQKKNKITNDKITETSKRYFPNEDSKENILEVLQIMRAEKIYTDQRNMENEQPRIDERHRIEKERKKAYQLEGLQHMYDSYTKRNGTKNFL